MFIDIDAKLLQQSLRANCQRNLCFEYVFEMYTMLHGMVIIMRCGTFLI